MGPTHLCMYMYVCIEPECVSGAGTAQLVERSTEKPGAILTRVRGPGPARDFSPRVSFQCRLSYGVRTPPQCAIADINICALDKNLEHCQYTG